MGAKNIRVAGSNGLSLHVLEWSSSGVPLLLLHGFGNDSHIWDKFAPVVAPYYRTLALDLRGHGDSDRDPECRYDYSYHVNDLEAVTAALNIDRFVLVGHSLGGRIAILFAGAHLNRMAGLVLVDTGPELDYRGTSRIRAEAVRSQDESFSSIQQYESLLARLYPATSPQTLKKMAYHGVRKRSDSLYERKTDPRFNSMGKCSTKEEQETRSRQLIQSLWDSLEKITCPTLVVRGAGSDVLAQDVADRMTEGSLAKGQFALVANAGHSVMTDNPEGFARAVELFALGDA